MNIVLYYIISSTEPFWLMCVLIVYPWSGVDPSIVRSLFTMLKHLLQDRLANQSQIFVEPPWLGGRLFIRGIWVTSPRWPPRPYMRKNLQKFSPPEPIAQLQRNLACSICNSSPLLFVRITSLV